MFLKSSHGAGAVIIEDNKVLLVQMNYGKFKAHWVLPGGMVDRGEWPLNAAIREVLEETNQEIKIIKSLAVRHRKYDNPEKEDNIYWVFQGQRTKDKELKWNSNELIDVRWWDINNALSNSLVRPQSKYYIKGTLQNFNFHDYSYENIHIEKTSNQEDSIIFY